MVWASTYGKYWAVRARCPRTRGNVRKAHEKARATPQKIALRVSRHHLRNPCPGVTSDGQTLGIQTMDAPRARRGTPIPIPYIQVKLAVSHADDHLSHPTIVSVGSVVPERPASPSCSQISTTIASAVISHEGDRPSIRSGYSVHLRDGTYSSLVADLPDTDRICWQSLADISLTNRDPMVFLPDLV